MRKGLLLAVVAALIASATSPALAQEAVPETPGEEEYCAGPAATAYQYDCEGPQTPECAPQQQYAEDETGGCVAGPYQYDLCTASTSCDSEANAQLDQGDIDSSGGALPPASVQNVVIEAARSVTKDAPEASRALDTAQLKEPAEKVALAAEVETVAEPPAQQPPAQQPPVDPSQTPEETVEEPPAYAHEALEEADGESAAILPATEAPYAAAAPADTAEIAETTGIAELAEVTKPAEATQSVEATEPPEVVDDQEKQRGLEEADGEAVASHGLAPVDRFMVPLFALCGSMLLVGGGLLVRRIVG